MQDEPQMQFWFQLNNEPEIIQDVACRIIAGQYDYQYEWHEFNYFFTN